MKIIFLSKISLLGATLDCCLTLTECIKPWLAPAIYNWSGCEPSDNMYHPQSLPLFSMHSSALAWTIVIRSLEVSLSCVFLFNRFKMLQDRLIAYLPKIYTHMSEVLHCIPL